MDFTTVFLVTYKKLGNNLTLTEQDYNVALQRLKSNGTILDHRFEKDKKGILHVHCIYECRKNPYVRKFIIKGFHLNFTPVYDGLGVEEYIHKCDPDYKKSVIYLCGDALSRNIKAQQENWYNMSLKRKKVQHEREVDDKEWLGLMDQASQLHEENLEWLDTCPKTKITVRCQHPQPGPGEHD